MTRELLNTLYVLTQDASVSLKDDTVLVRAGEEQILRVPLHHLGAIFAFGIVHITQPLMARCAQEGRAVVLFDLHGRFQARIGGKTGGNVLLRRDQWMSHLDPGRSLALAKAFVAGKIQNARQVLLRGARDLPQFGEPLSEACENLAAALPRVATARDHDEVRGIEGMAAQLYFDVFDYLVLAEPSEFAFKTRSRRPPRDRLNALLSFVYSIATSDCVAALEGVGLDPQCGFLHVLRPGRPALALDLVEEFRSIILDRFCLTLVNRKQIRPSDFDERPGGSVMLNADGRKKVLAELQRRKAVEVQHPLLAQKVPIGLLPHLQARLLARTLRGDLTHYPPYVPS
jgi:CRISPR-associated protein Cas1